MKVLQSIAIGLGLLSLAPMSFARGESASVQPGEFNLYPSPEGKPEQPCYSYKKLVLVQGKGHRGTARLETKFVGSCPRPMIAIRTAVYDLSAKRGGCGSVVYTGGERVGLSAIMITDHRKRICRDLQPNLIQLRQVDESGREKRFYSAPFELDVVGGPVVIDHTLEYSGVLESHNAIGSETSGFALKTSDNLIELDFDDDKVREAAESLLQIDGIEVTVEGSWTVRQGVERGDYAVLVAFTSW